MLKIRRQGFAQWVQRYIYIHTWAWECICEVHSDAHQLRGIPHGKVLVLRLRFHRCFSTVQAHFKKSVEIEGRLCHVSPHDRCFPCAAVAVIVGPELGALLEHGGDGRPVLLRSAARARCCRSNRSLLLLHGWLVCIGVFVRIGPHVCLGIGLDI